jgi:hypothetical protein
VAFRQGVSITNIVNQITEGDALTIIDKAGGSVGAFGTAEPDVGQYLAPVTSVGATPFDAVGAGGGSAGDLRAIPFYIPRRITFDAIAWYANATANGSYRWGIYNNALLVPTGAPLVDQLLSFDGANTIKTAALNVTLNKGYYWCASLCVVGGTTGGWGLHNTTNRGVGVMRGLMRSDELTVANTGFTCRFGQSFPTGVLPTNPVLPISSANANFVSAMLRIGALP